MKVKTFKIGTDSDETINEFIASVRPLKDGLTLLSGGEMQILYTDKETPEELAERLKGLSKDGIVTTILSKIAGAQGSLIDHDIKILEAEITVKNMTVDTEKKATKDMLDKQNSYLDTLKKEREYMIETINGMRDMVQKMQDGELVV